MLEAILIGRLTFTPQGSFYEIRGLGSLGRVITATLSTTAVVNPGGIRSVRRGRSPRNHEGSLSPRQGPEPYLGPNASIRSGRLSPCPLRGLEPMALQYWLTQKTSSAERGRVLSNTNAIALRRSAILASR